ncbi:uncharacterized protein LOC128998916 [Macrosteles quadrilineatus]|uniref:uncharacterized protein LOC128998916 n=1 Tax=Macrosteles quadrilineatus TaxID=74068 RepID=UPI0023E1BF4F|nr:uncharacterized protein LOC128998916 [Macrosteles quadrilineatus]
MNIELCGVTLHDFDILIISVYRPPTGNLEFFFYTLDKCLCYLTNIRPAKNIVLGGDFNIALNSPTAPTQNLEELLRGQGLYITNYLPTRGDRCLDTVVTNLDTLDYNTNVLSSIIADHAPVQTTVWKKRVSETPTIPSWHMNYLSYRRPINEDVPPSFKEALSNVNWSEVLNLKEDGDILQQFHNKFVEVFDTFFPMTVRPRVIVIPKKTKKLSNDWYTAELGKFRLLVQLIFDKYKAEASVERRDRLYALYLKAKRNYQVEVDAAKKLHTVHKIERSNNKCKAAWSVINESRKSRATISSQISPDEFNSYFVSTVDDIVNDMQPDSSVAALAVPVAQHNFLKWRPTTSAKIIRITKNFSNSYSPDIYGLTPHILKHIIEAVAQPLCKAINCCLSTGVFPDCLKISRTVPIFKKGDVNAASSYRPISIIPCLAKILEKIMQNQIVDYFETNHLFSNSQHGFRKGKSTATALISPVKGIQNAFEDKHSMSIVLCDLSKAFDVVSHSILLQQLARYGLGGIVLKTLDSYLCERSQMVAIQGALSAPAKMDHGVPQGSILGPSLFLILMNDLGSDDETLLYADDTTLCGRGQHPLEAAAKSDELFNNARSWFGHYCILESHKRRHY